MCLPISRKHILKVGQVTHAFNSSAKEAETGQLLWLAGQPTWKVPGHWETLSPKEKRVKSTWGTTCQTPKTVFGPPHTNVYTHIDTLNPKQEEKKNIAGS